MGRIVLVGMVLAAGVPVPAAGLGAGGETTVCQETHIRHLDAYHGTGKVLDATGNVVASVDGLELTDHVSQNLATQIYQTHSDARVRDRIGS